MMSQLVVTHKVAVYCARQVLLQRKSLRIQLNQVIHSIIARHKSKLKAGCPFAPACIGLLQINPGGLLCEASVVTEKITADSVKSNHSFDHC